MWAVTLTEFLPEQLTNTAILACFGCIAWCLSLVGSSRRRFMSTVTLPIVVLSYFAAGFVTLVVYPTAGGIVIFLSSVVGGLAGVPSGLLISGFIWKYYRPEIEGDEDTR